MCQHKPGSHVKTRQIFRDKWLYGYNLNWLDGRSYRDRSRDQTREGYIPIGQPTSVFLSSHRLRSIHAIPALPNPSVCALPEERKMGRSKPSESYSFSGTRTTTRSTWLMKTLRKSPASANPQIRPNEHPVGARHSSRSGTRAANDSRPNGPSNRRMDSAEGRTATSGLSR